MTASSTRIREALARPESYPHRPPHVDVRETHLSWVFLAGALAYKLKKPLVLDFVDYGTAARRRLMCCEEVRLNRRLAPDIYLGVRGVAETVDGAELTSEDDPRAVDFVVEMRRYDERRTLAAELERGELRSDQIEAVGRRLARFHAEARAVEAAHAPVLAVERRFERNLHELLASVEQRAEIGRVQALERFAHAFIAGHAQTFLSRASAGRIRDGHGDLRAEHVLLDGGVRIVDCVEFDPALRELDVADDLAFLVFDLAAGGAERFGELLVCAYREAGGDPGDDALLAFYAAYRALVRAKVALVRAAQLEATSAARVHESARAREEIAVAERFAWRARLPLVIVVCGAPASGKSRFASALAALSGLPHLNTDPIRKQLLGISASERAGGGAYTAEWDSRTYSELGRRAVAELARARGAIIDGTFRLRADRESFAASFGAAAPVLFIECRAPLPVRRRRAGLRARDPMRASDADEAVVAHETIAWEPLDEVTANAHIALRSDRPVDEMVDDALALLDQRLLARG
jgi:aminoglycoside phosphotransferase family enzyme/predicted kinase